MANDLPDIYPTQLTENIRHRSKIITFIASSLSENQSISNFAIRTNFDHISRFNNFIIKVWSKVEKSNPHAYLCETDYISAQVNSDGEKYKIQDWKKEMMNIINKKNEIAFIEDVPNTNIRFCSCSDSFITEDVDISPLEECTSRGSIFSLSKTYKTYRFSSKYTSEREDCLNRLYFVENLKNNSKIESDIGDILRFSKKSISNIVEYVEQKLNSRQATITKHSFETELLGICLEHLIVKPTSVVDVNAQTACLWNKLTLKHEVTLIEDINGIQSILFGCFLQEIDNISNNNFKWNDYLIKNGKISKDFNVQSVLDNLKDRKKIQDPIPIPNTIESLLLTMWKYDCLPLILKTEAEIPILGKYKHLRKRFVILGNVQKNYDFISISFTSIFTNVADIRVGELRNQLLDQILISLQGRKPVRLYEIIGDDSDSMKQLSCARVLHLIKKRKTYLQRRALRQMELMMAVINDENSSEQSKVIAVADCCSPNISVNCKSINVEVYINQMKKHPKFERYSVYHLQRFLNQRELLFLSGDSHRVRNYLVDQDGDPVYDFGTFQSVPVLGRRLNDSIQRRIDRYLRKATLKRTLLEGHEKLVCLMCGDIESLDISVKRLIIRGSSNFEAKVESSLQMDKAVIIDVRDLSFQEYWAKFSGVGWPLFHVKVVDSSLELLEYTNCSNLSTYLAYGGESFEEGKFFEKITNKMSIICGEMGIGKTSLLHLLSEVYDEKNYFLFYNFPDYREDYLQFAPNFFRNTLAYIFDQFESGQFKEFLRNVCNYHESSGRLVLFVDCLDKILPFFEPFVLGILGCLATTNTRVIMASRMISGNVLIDSLEVQPVKINHIKREDVKDYLKSRNLGRGALDKLPLDFLSNPLYLDCLQSLCRRGDRNFENIDNFDIYKVCVQKIIELQYCQIVDDAFPKKSLLKHHRILALVSLFGKKIILDKGVIQDYDAFIEEFKNDPEIQLGFVKEFRGNYPVFQHQAFAQFLAMDWLNENLTAEKSAKILYKNMMFKCVSVRYLFDRMICKDLDLHEAVLKKDFARVEALCKQGDSMLRQVDKCGRTPLHLVCSYCFDARNYPILELIVEHMLKRRLDFNANDLLMGWDWIQYLSFSNNRFLNQVYSHGLTSTLQVYLKYSKKRITNEDISNTLSNNHVDTALVLFKNNPLLLRGHFNRAARIAIDLGRLDIFCNLLRIQYSDSIAFRVMDNACKNIVLFPSIVRYIKMKTRDGLTPLHLACIYGPLEVVAKLLSTEEDLLVVDNFGKIPLHYGVIRGSVEIVSILIKKMSVIHYVDEQSNGPLHLACQFSKVEVVELLLKNSVYIGATNSQGSSALHLSSERGRAEIAQILVDYGANVAQKDRKGNTPLHLACLRNHRGVVECLIRKSDDAIAIRNNNGLTPFDIACLEEKHEIVRFLMKNSATVMNTAVLESALCNVVKEGKLTTLKILTEQNLLGKHQLECTVGENGRSLLHLATMHGHTNIVRFLLRKEVKVDPVDGDGCTPLHLARGTGVAKLLLAKFQNTADAFSKSFKGETPLHTACRNRHTEVVKVLLSENTDVLSSKDVCGWTPLHRAVVSNAVDIVGILVKSGADVNATDDESRTALHLVFHRDPQFRKSLVAHSPVLELLNVLLRNGADPTLKNNNGDTVLHVGLKQWDSTSSFSYTFVDTLLKYGADPFAVNKDGKSSMDIAKEAGLRDIWPNVNIKV